MRTIELRIGNLIAEPYDNSPETVGIIVNYKDGEAEINEEIISYFNPIPLTEEWLLKLGFNIDYKKGYIGIDVNHTDFVLTYPKIMGEWQNHFAFEFQAGGWPRYVQIKYVHQLQNLYFSLTGEELEVK